MADPKLHRVLVVGVGSIGERHLRCFKNTGRADVGFVEVNPSLRETVAQRYGVKDASGDLDSALGKGFDVGLIATPAQMHVGMATKLVEAGLHVLIEKPLSTTLDGIDQLREAVARTGRTAGVAYVYRAMPPLIAMREAIHSGRFGTPVEFVFVGGQHFPFFRPAYREIYYKDRATGGGAIQDALTHILNASEWLVGPIDRIVADAEHLVLEGVSVEDSVNALTRHGPVLGSFSLNQHQAPNEIVMTVICERGTARFEAHNYRWRWTTRPDEPWHGEAYGQAERDTPFLLQANAFLDAVEGKRPVPCSLEEGEQTLRVNLAALESVEKRAWVSVR